MTNYTLEQHLINHIDDYVFTPGNIHGQHMDELIDLVTNIEKKLEDFEERIEAIEKMHRKKERMVLSEKK